MEYKIIYNALPTIIKKILILSNGWLVGSTINNIIENKSNKDYDILITDVDKFHEILLFLDQNNDIELNTFGGIKYKIGELYIDIWTSTLDKFFKNKYEQPIFNLNNRIILTPKNL